MTNEILLMWSTEFDGQRCESLQRVAADPATGLPEDPQLLQNFIAGTQRLADELGRTCSWASTTLQQYADKSAWKWVPVTPRPGLNNDKIAQLIKPYFEPDADRDNCMRGSVYLRRVLEGRAA